MRPRQRVMRQTGMRTAEIRGRRILADIDNAAANGARAREQFEQGIAVAAPDRARELRQVLVERAEHLQHGVVLLSRQIAVGKRPPAHVEERVLIPLVAGAGRHDLLGKNVQRRTWNMHAIESAVDDALRDAGVTRVAEIMSADLLVVAPEDTLGEVAERMRERDVGSALVAEYGRLIGILTSRDMLRALAHSNARSVYARTWNPPWGEYGGDTTALAVHVVTAPCHVAALPVAVNLGCSAVRSASVEVGA